MKMKLSEILEHYKSMTNSGILDQTLPAKLSYAISRNVKKLEDEVKVYEDERKKLCERLAEKDDKGAAKMIEKSGSMIYDLTDEAAKTLSEELDDLTASEIEIDIHTVGESVIEQCDQDRYHIPTARELAVLDFMIVGK